MYYAIIGSTFPSYLIRDKVVVPTKEEAREHLISMLAVLEATMTEQSAKVFAHSCISHVTYDSDVNIGYSCKEGKLGVEIYDKDEYDIEYARIKDVAEAHVLELENEIVEQREKYGKLKEKNYEK